jgi:hypothetical protein
VSAKANLLTCAKRSTRNKSPSENFRHARRLRLRTISSLHASASSEANEWRHASPIDFAESVTVSFDSERSRLRHGSDIGLKPVPLSYSFNR